MRALALFAIGLIFGGGFGFLMAASQGVTLDGHDHSDPAMHGPGTAGGAAHAELHDTPLEVAADEAPKVSIMLMPDPMSGYNLRVMTDGFTFVPQSVSGAHVAGEGHAHVYVNDVKLSRLYGEWMHIGALPKGDVTVSVTLNTNDHRVYAVDGRPVEASTSITVE